jgi:hypothetical protein
MARPLAWISTATGILLAAVGAAVAAAGGVFGAEEVLSILYALAAGTVGGLVASRQPRNAIGWILCGLTIWIGVQALARSAADYRLAEDRSDQWGELAAWVTQWGFVPLIFVPATFLLLLFPDGRLPSHRFRPIAWAAGAVVGFWIVTTALEEEPVAERYEGVENPFAVDADWLQLASDLAAPLMLVCVVASAASVLARVRRASPLERQQMKVLAYAGCIAVASLIVGGIGDIAALRLLSGLILPIAIGIAVLRYGLYDIDVVINRTLVYVPLIAIIGGVSTALVPFSHRVFRGITGSDSDASIVLTTLLIAAVVAPLRKRLEGLVEGRFRARPSPSADGKALLEDPQFIAFIETVARRAAHEAVEERR